MLIDEIRDRFTGAGMTVDARSGFCRVPARNSTGFDVWVEELGPKHWRVGFADWSEQYTDQVQVLACFALGLSSHARLEVKSRAGRDFRWTVQQQRGGAWVNGSSVEKKAFSIWPVVRTRLLQNDWLRERPVISDIERQGSVRGTAVVGAATAASWADWPANRPRDRSLSEAEGSLDEARLALVAGAPGFGCAQPAGLLAIANDSRLTSPMTFGTLGRRGE